MLNLNESASNPRMALALCRMVALLDSPDPVASIGTVCNDTFGGACTVVYVPINGMKPAFAGIRRGRQWILVINGVRSAEQFDAIRDGYFRAPSTNWANGCHQLYADQAFGFTQTLVTAGYNYGDDLVMGGHSYGGAIIAAIASGLKLAAPNATMSYASFGAPKTGNVEFQNQIDPIPKSRWMTVGDPVPFIFPSPEQAPLFYLASPLSLFSHTQTYLQSNGGQVFRGGNTVESAVLPSSGLTLSELDFVVWFRTLTNDTGSPHRIDNYLGLLSSYVATLPPAAEPVLAPQGHHQAPQPRPTADATQAAREITRAIQARSYVQNERPPVIPAEDRFRAVKLNGLWSVTFRGACVAWALRKRRASHMAFIGNTFLREYLKSGIAYPDALTSNLVKFMSDAEDPASGIAPTLETEIPPFVQI